MWELDHKEGWALKDWCFQTVALEKTLESPLDSKEIKQVKPKRNEPWTFIGKTEAEAPILWPPTAKSRLLGKDPDAGKDWRQEEKEATEDEMVGWHHQLYGQEFEQTLGDGAGQGSPACYSPWGHKESDMTKWLNSKRRVWPLEWPAWWGTLFFWVLQLLDILEVWFVMRPLEQANSSSTLQRKGG